LRFINLPQGRLDDRELPGPFSEEKIGLSNGRIKKFSMNSRIPRSMNMKGSKQGVELKRFVDLSVDPVGLQKIS